MDGAEVHVLRSKNISEVELLARTEESRCLCWIFVVLLAEQGRKMCLVNKF